MALLACLAAVLLYSFTQSLLYGATNILRGGIEYFSGAFWLIGLAGFQLGAILALSVTTAYYSRNAGDVIRNGTVAAFVFILIDTLASVTVP
jgi:hypothetical protein